MSKRRRGGGGAGAHGAAPPPPPHVPNATVKPKAEAPHKQSALSNDYALHFVDSAERPVNYVRDTAPPPNDHAEYPKLRELIALKDRLVEARATPPAHLAADLKTYDLSSLGSKFDVILIDPPWEEYSQRLEVAGDSAAASALDVWTPDEILQLRVDEIGASPSFVFLWCGSGATLEWGRKCLLKWGYRRCEDVCWIKSNRERTRNTQTLPDSVVAVTTEHCLVGIKGTVRRNFDGRIIHANIDTDVILSEEPPLGVTDKPVELYSIIERFCNGRRRLELFGSDRSLRRGWLTVGKGVSESNYDASEWARGFEGTFDCEVLAGEPPQQLSNALTGSSPAIESIRPKSPTELREEAGRELLREHRERDEAQRAEWQKQAEAAAEMGIELEPLPQSEPASTQSLPAFVEQHPFNAGLKSDGHRVGEPGAK